MEVRGWGTGQGKRKDSFLIWLAGLPTTPCTHLKKKKQQKKPAIFKNGREPKLTSPLVNDK
jgi:hypothetical protein